MKSLSKREIEVMTLSADGLITKQIAITLNISPKTTEGYIKNALSKLHANTKTHGIAIMFKQGILK